MNKRIAEIAEAAAEYALLNQSGEALVSEAEGCDEICVSREFIEKFAELIVRECMEQVWYSREDGINGNVSEVIKERMKQHFGVEG